jgi:hypothetical protein
MSNESYVKHSTGGTLFAGPDAVSMIRAFTIASGLSLYAKAGIVPNRAWTPTKMLQAASGITGKKYKRGQHAQAAADVKAWAEEMKSALPHIVEK